MLPSERHDFVLKHTIDVLTDVDKNTFGPEEIAQEIQKQNPHIESVEVVQAIWSLVDVNVAEFVKGSNKVKLDPKKASWFKETYLNKEKHLYD